MVKAKHSSVTPGIVARGCRRMSPPIFLTPSVRHRCWREKHHMLTLNGVQQHTHTRKNTYTQTYTYKHSHTHIQRPFSAWTDNSARIRERGREKYLVRNEVFVPDPPNRVSCRQAKKQRSRTSVIFLSAVIANVQPSQTPKITDTATFSTQPWNGVIVFVVAYDCYIFAARLSLLSSFPSAKNYQSYWMIVMTITQRNVY